MNNRIAQSAAGSRAAETYIVDLTTVCLSSGTVRLPLSLLGRFSEGQHVVLAGGEELVIEFEAPRTLSGLAPFFGRSELRANDRVRFVFDGERLELEAHKRERPRVPAAATSSTLAHATPVAQRLSADTAANGYARIPQRGLFAEPAQLVEAPMTSGLGTSEGRVSANPASEAPTSDLDNTIKAIRRVRIEGGDPPRTDTVAPRPVDRASAHDVWARRQRPSWRALDTMVAGPVVDPEEAAEAFSDSIVRVVRRSKGTVTPLAAEIPPLRPKPAPEEERAAMSYSLTWPLPEEHREKPKARPADMAASRPANRRVEQPEAAVSYAHLDPVLDAPINADAEQYVQSGPTILESDLLSLPTSGRWRTESEEAYLKYQEAQLATAQEPVAVPAGRRGGFLGRLGFGRNGRDNAPVGSTTGASDSAHWADDAPRQPAPAFPAGSEPVDLGADLADEQAARQVALTDTQNLLIVDESVYDVDFETAVEEPRAAVVEAPGSIEDDMKALHALLAQPDVPAIVKCDDLAARLRISPQRVSRAMQRLAEDRDRFTPLRGDAYMVRKGA